MVREPWEQCRVSVITPQSVKILCYEFGVLVLSCVRQEWIGVFKVGTGGHFGKESSLEGGCAPTAGELQAHSISVQICLLQCYCNRSLLPWSRFRISTASFSFFFFFTINYLQSFLFLLQPHTRHSSINGICLWPQSIKPLRGSMTLNNFLWSQMYWSMWFCALLKSDLKQAASWRFWSKSKTKTIQGPIKFLKHILGFKARQRKL